MLRKGVPKKRISKQGCFNCKRLKIKCNEARPICEYCSYRGRRCVYPDNFQAAEDGPVPKDVIELYSGSSSSSGSPMDDEVFSEHRRLTFQIVLDSTANILELSRFELRVLRFFSDVCVPYMTYNVNRRHAQVWEYVVPRHVAGSRAIKSAALAMGCLHLMPFLGLERYIEGRIDDSRQAALTLEVACDEQEVKRQISLSVGEQEPEGVNIYKQSCSLFLEAVRGIQEAITYINNPDTLPEKRLYYLTTATLTNYLTLGFLVMQPWGLLPLVYFPEEGEEPKTDILNIATGFKAVIHSNLPVIRSADFGDLFYMDEMCFSFNRRVKIVDDLKDQFNEYLRGIPFSGLDGRTNLMIRDLRRSLEVLEKVLALSIRFNYPVTLFKWLVMVSLEFTPHIRAKEHFALRLLYVYACICVYCKCWVFECNVWRDFIVWYKNNCAPLCEFDRRLYHYVVTRRIYIDGENYKSLQHFDVWSSDFDYDGIVEEDPNDYTLDLFSTNPGAELLRSDYDPAWMIESIQMTNWS